MPSTDRPTRPDATLCSACTKALRADRLPTECPTCGRTLSAMAPPGWEAPVAAMKRDDAIVNPYPVAWYMHAKGELAATADLARCRTMSARLQHALIRGRTGYRFSDLPLSTSLDAGEPSPEGTHPEPDGDETETPDGLVEPHPTPHVVAPPQAGDVEAVTPPGMEDVVHELKQRKNVDNPWAVAWSIYNDKQEGMAASALLRACLRASAAVSESPVVGTFASRLAHRAVAPPVDRRYTLHAEAVMLPRLQADEGHPNRVPFKAVLHPVDRPSDKPPNGSDGHLVVIPRAVAQRRLHTLVGMGINIASDGLLGSHDGRNKIGMIYAASLGEDPDPRVRIGGFTVDPNAVMIAGWLYGKDYPVETQAVLRAARAGVLGTSYEVSNVAVADPRANPWVATDLTYTGAAALQRTAAAYQSTQLAAASA